MKIAFCLFGQPRNYKKGYETFMEWFQFNNINVEEDVDFFFHAWTLNPGEKYNASNYRAIPDTELNYQSVESVESDLLHLYHPVKHIFEKQKSPDFFPVEKIKNTIAYRNITDEKTRDCAPNVLSQLYSLYKVYILCKQQIEEFNTNYDCIIVSRFDFINSLKRVRLNDWDYKTKVILPENRYPRKLICSSFIIMPPKIFLVWMPFYKHLDKIVNNLFIDEIMKKINEKWIFNTEEIYTAFYLYNFRNYNNIVYIYPTIFFTNNI